MIDLLPMLDDERRLPATDRKRRETAARGSQADAGPVARPLSFLAALLTLWLIAPASVNQFALGAADCLAAAGGGSWPALTALVAPAAWLLVAPALAGLATGTAARAALGCSLWCPGRLCGGLGALRSLSGSRAWAPVNIGASAGLWAIRASALAVACWAAWPRLAMPEGAGAAPLLRPLVAAGVAWLAAGTIEHLLARSAFEASIRMTRQEAKEEHKSVEGDPAVESFVDAWVEERVGHGGERPPRQAVPRGREKSWEHTRPERWSEAA